MRRGLVAAAVLVALASAVVPALAARDTVTVTALDFEFSPPEMEITAGDTVKFAIGANTGSSHNFSFADGPDYPDVPRGRTDPAWASQSRTFAQPGRYTYVCGAHSFMTGVIDVKAATSTPTPTPTSTSTATPTPTPTPTPGPVSGTQPSAEPEVRSLKLGATRFCARRCAIRLRIDLTAPAIVRGTLLRRGRRYGRVDFSTVPAGARTLRFRRTAAGRRLVPGRYVLRLEVAGDRQPVLRFRVR